MTIIKAKRSTMKVNSRSKSSFMNIFFTLTLENMLILFLSQLWNFHFEIGLQFEVIYRILKNLPYNTRRNAKKNYIIVELKIHSLLKAAVTSKVFYCHFMAICYVPSWLIYYHYYHRNDAFFYLSCFQTIIEELS